MTTIDLDTLSTAQGGQFSPCANIEAKAPNKLTTDDWALGVAQCGWAKVPSKRLIEQKRHIFFATQR